MSTDAGHPGLTARGRLRIYLGFAPGVGTTSALLDEGRQRAERGTDVVVAHAETHGRPGPSALLAGLEVVPPARVPDRGTMAEMDVGGVLARRPQVALVDEFAHGAPPRQTVPDPVVRAAAEVELVDLAPEALRDRMARGHIYSTREAEAALGGWFRIGNLRVLRGLALLWLAGTLASDPQRYRPSGHDPCSGHARERVVVALGGGPESELLIRRAAESACTSSPGGHFPRQANGNAVNAFGRFWPEVTSDTWPQHHPDSYHQGSHHV